jgi:membrane protein
VLTAAATTITGVCSTVYMPHAIARSAASYGEIGVTISPLSWLVGVGFALVICAAVGAVLAERLQLTPPPGAAVPAAGSPGSVA